MIKDHKKHYCKFQRNIENRVKINFNKTKLFLKDNIYARI